MALLNSEFCTRGFLDSNLKITNWHREASGCDCSVYQKYVDWCGCSPQVIRLSQLQTIQKVIVCTLYITFTSLYSMVVTIL